MLGIVSGETFVMRKTWFPVWTVLGRFHQGSKFSGSSWLTAQEKTVTILGFYLEGEDVWEMV